jgi:hypothetical protein
MKNQNLKMYLSVGGLVGVGVGVVVPLIAADFMQKKTAFG